MKPVKPRAVNKDTPTSAKLLLFSPVLGSSSVTNCGCSTDLTSAGFDLGVSFGFGLQVVACLVS